MTESRWKDDVPATPLAIKGVWGDKEPTELERKAIAYLVSIGMKLSRILTDTEWAIRDPEIVRAITILSALSERLSVSPNMLETLPAPPTTLSIYHGSDDWREIGLALAKLYYDDFRFVSKDEN